jgi:hypothetical protein
MKLEDFYDDLMPRLSGADESLVKHETFAAVRKLCEEGWAWVMDVGPLNVRVGADTVYLNPLPENTSVGYILQAQFTPTDGSTGYLTATANLPLDRATLGTPATFYHAAGPGTIKLVPTPDKDHDKSLIVVCSVIPANVTVVLPDYFNTHYRDAVIDGVCSRMMAMSSKPWSNMTMATYHGRSFNNHIKRSRSISLRRFSLAENNWAFPRQFMGR